MEPREWKARALHASRLVRSAAGAHRHSSPESVESMKREAGKYYQVIGHSNGRAYQLGYTSNMWAWIHHANGWKREQLEFRPLYRKGAKV